MLRNDTYFFSQLGTFIERANSTARIIDVKYFLLLPHSVSVGGETRHAAMGSDPALGIGAARLSMVLSRQRLHGLFASRSS